MDDYLRLRRRNDCPLRYADETMAMNYYDLQLKLMNYYLLSYLNDYSDGRRPCSYCWPDVRKRDENGLVVRDVRSQPPNSDAGQAFACVERTDRLSTLFDRTMEIDADSLNIAAGRQPIDSADVIGNVVAYSVTVVAHAVGNVAVAGAVDVVDEAVNELELRSDSRSVVGVGERVANELDDSDVLDEWIDDLDDDPYLLDSVCPAPTVDNYDLNLCLIAADCVRSTDDSQLQVNQRLMSLTSLMKEHLHCLRLSYSNYYSFATAYYRLKHWSLPNIDPDIHLQSPATNCWHRCPDNNGPFHTF